jgi:hypothetical protein
MGMIQLGQDSTTGVWHDARMSTYRRPLGAALTVAALAFALAFGAVSGAGAAGLTNKTVKKIATKVVKKQAKSLSVAHAATADSAATATTAATATVADKVRARSFTVSDVGSATTHNITFPGLAAGTYLATYSLAVNLASGKSITCGFEPGTVAPSETVSAGFATVSGAAVVTVGTGFQLGCTATAAFEVNPYYGETVSFVPVTTIAAAANQS